MIDNTEKYFVTKNVQLIRYSKNRFCLPCERQSNSTISISTSTTNYTNS